MIGFNWLWNVFLQIKSIFLLYYNNTSFYTLGIIKTTTTDSQTT